MLSGTNCPQARPAAKIGARATKGAAVMSELDVIVIHIRAEQAAEYERLFAERALARVQGARRLHQRPDIPCCVRHRPA